MKVIKRYSNRKLYDTEAGAYITLDGLREMIRQGEDIQVIDYVTGADLTTLTMLQILFDQEKQVGNLLPGSVLSQIIRNGSRRMDNLREGLRAFVDPNRHAEEEFHRRLKRLVEGGQLSEADRQRLEKLFMQPQIRQVEPDPDEEPASPDDLQELMTKLEELQKKLSSLS